MSMLVRFTNLSTGDYQYHLFTGCKNRIEFVHDSLFIKFVHDCGYSWEAIEFPETLAFLCMFTQSEVEHHG